MFGHCELYLSVFLTGFGVTYLLTPLARRLASRFGVVDRPDARRVHKQPTPRGGGIAVIVGVHAGCLLAVALPWVAAAGGFSFHWWQRFALASLVLLVVGLLDDVRGLPPWLKLGGQAAAALFMGLSETRFGSVFGWPLPWPLDCLLVVFWLVAVINAFNLIDGLDGLASGLAIISASGLCGIFLLGHLPGNVLVLVALIGACLAFLRFNFHPAKIFLGDTGSMFLGFTLGVVSLQTFTKSTLLISLTIPMLVLGVPIYDELLAVWRRSVRLWLAQRSATGTPRPRGIMQPDVEHLHHRLVRAGLSTRRAAGFLWALNAGLATCGVLIAGFQSHAAGMFLLVFLGVACMLMPHLAVIELCDTGRALLLGLRRSSHVTLRALAGPAWDMACLAGALALLMRLFEPPTGRFWQQWFLDLPLWVTPTLMLLSFSRTYVTAWSRTWLWDVLQLLGSLQIGILLSLGVALLVDPADAPRSLRRALLMAGLSHPAVLSLRLLSPLLEQWVAAFRFRSQPLPGPERVVLYGAGGRCQLFLKERGFSHPGGSDRRQIVGLLDDDPSLHGQWVYGYLVLGGLKDLPQLIERERINGIIITADLSPESRTAVQALALREGLPLSEWAYQERALTPASTAWSTHPGSAAM